MTRTINLFFTIILASHFIVHDVSALQVMLKDKNWYCFSVPVDYNTVLDFNFGMAGSDPEEIQFEAR